MNLSASLLLAVVLLLLQMHNVVGQCGMGQFLDGGNCFDCIDGELDFDLSVSPPLPMGCDCPSQLMENVLDDGNVECLEVSAPTSMPVESPTVLPTTEAPITDAPTPEGPTTLEPTPSPLPPILLPTIAPVPIPTEAPITDAPTTPEPTPPLPPGFILPTIAPVPIPTDAPITEAPTLEPTPSPLPRIILPTIAPVPIPTEAPIPETCPADSTRMNISYVDGTGSLDCVPSCIVTLFVQFAKSIGYNVGDC